MSFDNSTYNLEVFVMLSTTMVQAELHELAKAHLLAKSAFNQAYLRFWETQVKPCSDDMGWKLLETFRVEVEKFRFKYGRSEQGIGNASWELFRLELVGEADYRFEDVVGFVKWYESLKGKISGAIGHLYEYHGDSFGDLVDSYPLGGRELVERALATHPNSDRPRRQGYIDEREVRDTVLEKLGMQWHKLICGGENYVESALEAACHKCYLHRILTGQDEQVSWTEEEKGAVDYACHFDA